MRYARGHGTHAGHLLTHQFCFMGAFQIGDIDAGCHEAGKLAIDAETRSSVTEEPAIFPVGTPQAVFNLTITARFECLPNFGHRSIAVIGMDTLEPAFARHLFHRASREVK